MYASLLAPKNANTLLTQNEQIENWVTQQLQKFLGLDNVADLQDHVLNDLDNEEEIRSYFLGLLGNGKAIQKFLDQLIEKKKKYSPRRKTIIPENVQVYVKKDLEDEFDGMKKKGKKKKQESNGENSPSSSNDTRPTIVQEGNIRYIVQPESSNSKSKGTGYRCDCQAVEHPLLGNCINCGKIICELEGKGPCTYCSFENWKKGKRVTTVAPATSSSSPSSSSNNNNIEAAAELEDLKKDKSRLERRVEKLQKDLEDLRNSSTSSAAVASEKGVSNEEVNELRRALDSERQKTAELSGQLKKESSEKSKAKESLENQEKREQEKIKKLEESERKSKQELEAARKENQQKTQQVLTYELELKQLREKSDTKSPKGSSESERAALESKVRELEVKLRTIEDDKQRMATELEQLKTAEEDHEISTSQLKKKKHNLKVELNQLKKEHEELNDSISQKDVAVKVYEDQIKQMKQEESRRNSKIATLEQELQSLKDKENDKRMSAMSKDEASKEMQTELTSLKKKLTEAKETISQLESKLKDQDQRISQLQATAVNEAKEKGELKAQLDEFQETKKDLKKFKERSKTAESDVEEKEREIERLKEELQEARAKSTTKSGSTPTIVASPSLNGADTKELEKQKLKLEKQVKELKSQVEDEKERADDLKDKIAEKDKEISSLKEELASASKRSGSGGNNSGSQADDDQQMKMKIQAKRQEKELEALKKKVVVLQRENQERQLIEDGIYASDVEYDPDTESPVGVKVVVENLISTNALEDPVNEDLMKGILGAIKKSFARSSYDTETLTYWLSFSTHLFKELQHQLPSDLEIDSSSLERVEMLEDLDDLTPVTKFFHELVSVSFDIYSVLLINAYGQMDNILTAAVLSSGDKSKKGSINDFPALLGEFLKLLRKHYLSEGLIKAFVKQIFYYVDAQLFNTLLQRPELYTCSAGFQIKMAISQVESSVSKLDKSLSTVANKQLNHIKEAVTFLVMDKSIVSDAQVVEQTFSHLNVVQLKHILDRFKPDELSPDPIPDAAKKAINDACKKNASVPLELDPMEIKKVNLLCSAL